MSNMHKKSHEWPEVPSDLLYLVAVHKHLSLADVARMAAVCKSWRFTLVDNDWFGLPVKAIAESQLSNNIPVWLMLSESADDAKMRGFFDLASRKVVEIYLPEAEGRRCCGSAYGWIITFGEDMEIHLLNPLSRTRLSLPSQLTFKDLGDGFTNEELHAEQTRAEIRKGFIHKAILTESPGSGKCTVVAILSPACSGLRLAYFRLGEDDSWTLIPTAPPDDILFYQGKLYGITASGGLEVFDLHDPDRDWEAVSPQLEWWFFKLPRYYDYCFYLAQVLGEIVAVARFCEEAGKDAYTTVRVMVFKLSEEKKWCKVTSLGDCCLFLGGNTAMCISPVPSCCRPNCIYFTDDYKEWYTCTEIKAGRDTGVYSMEDDTYTALYDDVSTSDFSPPIWASLNC